MLSSASVSPSHRSRSKSTRVTPGERVRRARVRAGFTQEGLAREADCTRNTIVNIESDKTHSRRTVEAIAQVLNTTPADLGFVFDVPLESRNLSQRERDLLNEVLALSPDEQARVFEVVAALRAKRKGARR